MERQDEQSESADPELHGRRHGYHRFGYSRILTITCGYLGTLGDIAVDTFEPTSGGDDPTPHDIKYSF